MPNFLDSLANLYDAFIVPILLPAAVSFIVALIVYNFKFQRERQYEVRKERLSKLLLPIYMSLKRVDILYEVGKKENAWLYGLDSTELWIELQTHLRHLERVVEENLYLADKRLSDVCLEFLTWSVENYSEDVRFRKATSEVGSGLDDSKLVAFKHYIYSTYDKEREKFLEL